MSVDAHVVRKHRTQAILQELQFIATFPRDPVKAGGKSRSTERFQAALEIVELQCMTVYFHALLVTSITNWCPALVFSRCPSCLSALVVGGG